MPIYEYRCNKCGHHFEAIQKVSDAPLKKCEKCKGKVERMVSSPAIQFKGTGWYITDYARKGSGAERASDESGKAGKPDKPDKGDTDKKTPKKASEKAG